MLRITFELLTGLARFSAGAVIVQGADVPVQVVFSAAPGSVDGLQFALGTSVADPEVLAFTADFTEENETTWSAVLDASDTRLAAFMTGASAGAVLAELICTLDGERRVAPHLAVTVQPSIVNGPETGEGGPDYYTGAETDALLAARALQTVAGKYRIKADGTFQIWNADQSLFHTLTLSGAAGAETLGISAGEA